jgi:hypothetical protein
MKNKGKKVISKIKRDLKMFLNSEEGKILEKNIVETAAMLGIIGIGILPLSAQSTAVHNNYLHHSKGTDGIFNSGHVSHSNNISGGNGHSSNGHDSHGNSIAHASAIHNVHNRECCWHDRVIGPKYNHARTCIPGPVCSHINVWIPM